MRGRLPDIPRRISCHASMQLLQHGHEKCTLHRLMWTWLQPRGTQRTLNGSVRDLLVGLPSQQEMRSCTFFRPFPRHFPQHTTARGVQRAHMPSCTWDQCESILPGFKAEPVPKLGQVYKWPPCFDVVIKDAFEIGPLVHN